MEARDKMPAPAGSSRRSSLPRYLGRLSAEYGSRRGWFRHAKWSAFAAMGGFRHERSVQWARVKRVVFVCAGNICRSPLAAAHARALGLTAVSAGVRCVSGHPVDPRAIRLAESHGLDIARERSAPIKDIKLSSTDLVVGMEPWHLACPEILHAPHQATLLGLWLERPRPYLHDPFCSSDEYFRRCAELIVFAVNRLAQEART